MDIEPRLHDDDYHPEGGELLTISTDAIEVYMPDTISQAIRAIQESEEQLQSQIRQKRKLVRGDYKVQEKITELKELSDKNLMNLATKWSQNKGPSAVSDHTSEEFQVKKYIHEQSNAIISSKMKEFMFKLANAVMKCRRNSHFHYHVVFFVFNSSNLTDLEDYKMKVDGQLMSQLTESDPDGMKLVISIDCDMKVENVIQHLDQELDKPLSMFKTAQMEGRDLVDENLLRWVIILFQSKFYLSQVAIDTVIKFLDEVHFQTGLRFILVFKKMEDGSEFTPGKHTMLHYEVVEKLNNYTYEFFNSLTGNRKGTLLPPAMMVDLINEHEIFRNHIEWTCFKVSGYISLHYASVSLTSHQQHVDESKKRALLKEFDAGRRFFAELLTEKIRRTLMVEMLDPYIQENLAFFYSDPDQVYLFDGGQVKERIRFSFQDISTVFCEGRDEIEKLLNNCNELIDLYQECLGKVKSDQLAQKNFAEVMGLIIKKIRDHQQAKSHPPMQEEINVFSKRRVKQVHNNPIDNEARHSLILKQATGRYQTEEETEETYFYKEIVLNITKALQDMHDRHMKKTLDKLSKDFPDCVLNQHSKFETILNPDPMQSYIDHLGKLWIPKQVRKPQGSSSSGPDMRPNLAELATKVVFELFAQGAISTLVEELLSPFAFRMQDQMSKFGLKWHEVQDTSLLAQQAHNGGGNSKETNIHLGAKYLFYYAVNVLKRAGLVQENSRSKRQMQKLFFAVADHGNRS